MVWVSNSQTLDDEGKDKNLAPAAGIPPTGGSSGSVRLAPSSGSVGGMSAAGGAGGTTPPGAGGSFATLDKYLTANQGQAAPLAGQITGNINKQYQNLSGQNDQTLQGINSQVSSGATPSNYNDIIAQESANPVSFAGDQGNVGKFQSLLNASYGGPTSAENTPEYQKQQAAINSAISQGQATTGTEAGRQQLLAQNEAVKTPGVTALNSAILSKSPEALASVQDAYKPFNSLLTGLNSGAQATNKFIAQNQANAAGANQAANAAITKQVNDLNAGLTTKAAQDQAAQDTYNSSLLAFRNQWNPINTAINNLNEQIPTFLGQGTPLVTNPITALVNTPQQNVGYTPTGVATAEDAAKGQAFQALLNGINTGAPIPLTTVAGNQTAPATFTTPSQNDLANQIATSENIAGTPSSWTNSYNSVLGGNNPTWTNIDPAFANLMQLLQKINPNVNSTY